MSDGGDYFSLPRFDIDEALKRCMGRRDFIHELSLVLVRESLPMYLPLLEQGMQNRDSTLIAKNAHGIKGGCAAIGLVRARDMAYAVELASKENDMNRVEKIVPLLFSELEAIVEAVNSNELIPEL